MRNRVALALTWDGARWPVARLPAKARAFLWGRGGRPDVPAAGAVARWLARDEVQEVRICWVPRLSGSGTTLADPFVTASGRRVALRAVRQVRFGEVLGVIYRSANSSKASFKNEISGATVPPSK